MSKDHVDGPIAFWRSEFPDAQLGGLELSGRLRALEYEMAKMRAEVLAPFGLDTREWDVLSALWRGRASAVSMSDLSADLLVVAGSITHRVTLLERRGFVQRSTDPASRRRVLVTLSSSGSESFHLALPAVLALSSAMEEAVSPDELAQLNRLLRQTHSAVVSRRSS